MGPALATKTEEKKKSQTPPEAILETHLSLQKEVGTPAGMPLFLQRLALSSAAFGVIQRQVEKSEEEHLQAKQDNALVQRQPIEDEELLQTSFGEAPPVVQTKLTVCAQDDEYEREADRVAETVMRMPDSHVAQPFEEEEEGLPKQSQVVQTKPITPLYIQHVCAECEEGLQQSNSSPNSMPTIQPKAGGEHSLSSSNQVARTIQSPSGGSPLPRHIQSKVGQVLGKDVSHVQVHFGIQANNAAQSINAKAFTHQNHIYLGKGQSANDVQLMAHELTHVAQQIGLSRQRSETFIQRYCETPSTCLEDLDGVHGDLAFYVALALANSLIEESNFAELLTRAAIEALPESLRADLESRSWEVADINYDGYTIPVVLRFLNVLHREAETTLALELARPSYGLEYVMQIMVRHIASHFIGALDPPYETHPVHAERSATALQRLQEDLQITLDDAISTPRNLMRLELEGTLNELIGLRLEFETATDRGERSDIGQARGVAARSALLLNQVLAKVNPDPTGVTGTDLDELLVDAAVDIAQIRGLAEQGEEVPTEEEQVRLEEQTISELEEGLELLAVTPIEETQPFFPEFLTPIVDETTGLLRLEVEPEEAFPRVIDEVSNQLMRQLELRIQEQQTQLETLRDQIIPDSYEMQDFAAVFRRWFAFFSLAQERQNPTVRLVLDLMNDIYQLAGADIYSGLGFASAISQGSSALGRARLLQDFAELLTPVLGGGATAQFAEQITQAPLSPREMTAGQALDPEFLFAQLYGSTAPMGECRSEESCREAEQSSRQRWVEQQQRQTAPPFVIAALEVSGSEQARALREEIEARSTRGRLTPRLPGAEQRERVADRERVARMAGEAISPNEERLPIYGVLENLSNPQAQESWHYLINVRSPLEERVALEHRIVPREVSEYLLAFRQHAETLRRRHTPMTPGLSGRPIGERAMRRGRLRRQGLSEEREAPGIESGEAANVERYLVGEPHPQPSEEAARLRHTLSEARHGAGIPGTSNPTQRATWALIVDMERYFDEFYAVHPEPSYRLASIFVLADIQFGVGRELMQLRNPEVIQEMASEAIRITLTLRTLSSLGPLGMLAAQGYRAYLGMQGPSEVAALVSIASFMQGASRANNFHAARAWSYMAPYIVDDVRELMESVVGSPARYAANLSFDILTGRRSMNPRGLAEWCRPLMGNPESRMVLMEGVDLRIAELEAEGAGTSRSIPEYNALIAFRDHLLQRTSAEQMELDIDPNMPLPGRSVAMSEVEAPPPIIARTPERRAELFRALGDLQGRVRVIENPDPRLGTTVRVHYRMWGRVWIEVGPEATAWHMRHHVEVARELMRYEGVFGRIWRLIQDVRRLLRGEPLTTTRHFEAELEVDKLMPMLDDLLAMREQIERRAEQLIERPERATTEREAISREIESLSQQLRRHILELGSREAGRGYVEASGTTSQIGNPAAIAEAIRLVAEEQPPFEINEEILRSMTPPDHYWRLLHYRPVLQPTHDSYRLSSRNAYHPIVQPFIRRSEGFQEESIAADSWQGAYEELGGNDLNTAFGKFIRVLEYFEINRDEITQRMQTTRAGGDRGNDPKLFSRKTIRGSVTSYYIEEVIMPYITCQDPFDRELWEHPHPFSQVSYQRLQGITRELASEHIGSISSRWFREMNTFITPYFHEVGFLPAERQLAQEEERLQTPLRTQEREALRVDPRESRFFDMVWGEIGYEFKNISGPLGNRERAEFADHILALGEEVQIGQGRRRISRLVWVMLNAEGVWSNALWMFRKLTEYSSIEFIIYNVSGENQTITRSNRETLINDRDLWGWLGLQREMPIRRAIAPSFWEDPESAAFWWHLPE